MTILISSLLIAAFGALVTAGMAGLAALLVGSRSLTVPPSAAAAAASWLVFGAYLHVAGRRDRWARMAPWLVVLGFAGVLFTYIGAGLFIVGEHSYGAP